MNKEVKTKKDDLNKLRGKFLLGILYYKFRRDFFSLFDDKCYKCKKLAAWEHIPASDEFAGGLWIQTKLDIDHHIPFERGGRLEGGNMVSLCKKCNSKKGTKNPEDFYDVSELEDLVPYLTAQELIVPKENLWNYGKRARFVEGNNTLRRQMLIEEGIEEELAAIVVKYEYHRYFCGGYENLACGLVVGI